MIQKMTSKELMDILESSQERIENLMTLTYDMKTAIEKRCRIVQNIHEFNDRTMADLKELFQSGTSKVAENTVVFGTNPELGGLFSRFGGSIHPEFLYTPENIFNFDAAFGPIFKDNVTVSMNETVLDEYKGMLMDDKIEGQPLAFEEFATQNITLDITVNPDNLLGSTAFNIMELVPFLPGSFDITGYELYTMEDYKLGGGSPSLELEATIPSVGMERIMLDQTRNLYRILIKIHLNFRNSDGLYPFGLKHLYFLKGDYNPNSYVLFSITKDTYVELVSEDIVLHDQNGYSDTNCTDERIQLYMNNVNGELLYPITTSKGINQKPLSKSVKTIYGTMPLTRSVTSLRFNSITTK